MLHRQIHAHQKWLANKNKGQRINLCDAKLIGKSFFHTDLSHAVFSGALLTDANFNCATLCEALLSDANLRGASIQNANLNGALLCDTDLRGATLHHTTMRGAVLLGAKLEGADLRHADLRGAIIDDDDNGVVTVSEHNLYHCIYTGDLSIMLYHTNRGWYAKCGSFIGLANELTECKHIIDVFCVDI